MKSVELKEFMALLMSFNLFMRLKRADELCWQRAKKNSVFSVSSVHVRQNIVHSISKIKSKLLFL